MAESNSTDDGCTWWPNLRSLMNQLYGSWRREGPIEGAYRTKLERLEKKLANHVAVPVWELDQGHPETMGATEAYSVHGISLFPGGDCHVFEVAVLSTEHGSVGVALRSQEYNKPSDYMTAFFLFASQAEGLAALLQAAAARAREMERQLARSYEKKRRRKEAKKKANEPSVN